MLLVPTVRADHAALPSWLPRYQLDMDLDLTQHVVRVREQVTWTNRHRRPSRELVFNAHAHYQVPESDVGLLAKMLELLRQSPSEGMPLAGPPLEVTAAHLCHSDGQPGAALSFSYRQDNPTALVVSLPLEVRCDESVTIVLDVVINLPNRQGRWGHWQGVTFLAQWLPVLAPYDEHGWQPTPFIPWHQPFFNEAGIYHVRAVLPGDQKVACSGSIVRTTPLEDGRQQVEIVAEGFRDFAFLCSARYEEHVLEADGVKLKCLAFPEHAFYARQMLRIVAEALPLYSTWIGPYPFAEFTLAESYFAWNGNECGGLVMVDERVFNMPQVAVGYVEYLISHEFCHQWWYNVIGTNGYCETWMDEAFATYFSHRLLDRKFGKNNALLKLPRGLEWLPNIYRENYRYSGLYGSFGRGENGPCVQDMTKFGHTVTLFSMCYDKGSKIVGMIEDRLGETAFLDFIRRIYCRYRFRILRVADFQRELEEYTGKSWEEFFRFWLYGTGLTDWCLEKVQLEPCRQTALDGVLSRLLLRRASGECQGQAYRVTVYLRQRGEYSEQTVVGFCLDGGDGFQVRVPVWPQCQRLQLEEPEAVVEMLPEKRVRVEVLLPCRPTQVAVDPDQVLVDRDPANNYWKPRVEFRLTPLYTMLEETDLTRAYDRWSVIAGPWVFGTAYNDPWYTRSSMFGFRVGAYRTQEFFGGAYLTYRNDFRDIVLGADGLWDHWPWPHTQVGFNAERRLTAFTDEERDANRSVLFGRYVFQYASSLYLPPMHYAEIFLSNQDNFLPMARITLPGVTRFTEANIAGVHYRVNYLTPYWDPEGGFYLDTSFAIGKANLGDTTCFQRVDGQFSAVKALPAWTGPLAATRWAARIYAGAGFPSRGQYLPLGGEKAFRAFDLAERQGSLVWLASLEWRFPLAQGLTWDMLDHTIGVRNIYGAAFYDVGDAYQRGRSLGPVAHGVGMGLRVDVAWFSIIERTIIRFDVAKAINVDAPVQFWLGVQHPF